MFYIRCLRIVANPYKLQRPPSASMGYINALIGYMNGLMGYINGLMGHMNGPVGE